jgi:predicted DNA-binding transcriptional regulator AlpA
VGVKAKGKSPKPTPVLPPGCDSLLSKSQVCAALGISVRTLDGMIASGAYPKPDIKLGPFPRWRVATHNAWIEARCTKRV